MRVKKGSAQINLVISLKHCQRNQIRFGFSELMLFLYDISIVWGFFGYFVFAIKIQKKRKILVKLK